MDYVKTVVKRHPQQSRTKPVSPRILSTIQNPKVGGAKKSGTDPKPKANVQPPKKPIIEKPDDPLLNKRLPFCRESGTVTQVEYYALVSQYKNEFILTGRNIGHSMRPEVQKTKDLPEVLLELATDISDTTNRRLRLIEEDDQLSELIVRTQYDWITVCHHFI